MASEVITQAELLDALAEAMGSRGPAEAKTIMEITRATGLGEKRIRAALQSLKEAGRLRKHRILRPRLDDVLVPVWGFTVAPRRRGK